MTVAASVRASSVAVARRYCLVTAAHPCNDPRLVKEADLLHAVGHEVTVVGIEHEGELAARDRTLHESRGWRLASVVARRDHSRWRWFGCSAAQRAARRVYGFGGRFRAIRDQAASRYVVPLGRAAARAAADVYVAHTLEALPAAAHAARARGARLVFDIEDLHSGQLPDDERYDGERALARDVERTYLSTCDRLIASSQGIAEEIVKCYGIAMPTVVLNVFPAAEAVSTKRINARGTPRSLYWFSQVIGAQRGVEQAVEALSLIEFPTMLHLRGRADAAFLRHLHDLAARHGVADRLKFHQTAHPDRLVALAAEHDIGLALEPGFSRNNVLATSNKVFTYMLAGLAIVASDTRGHTDVLSEHPGAVLFRRGDARDLASKLSMVLRSPESLTRMQHASRALATERYCWEREQWTLLEALSFDDDRVSTTAVRSAR